MNLTRDDYIVKSVPWKIREVPASNPYLDDKYGRTIFDTYTIYLWEGMPWQQKIETLVHETSHVLCEGKEKVNLLIEDDLRTYSEDLIDTLIRNGLVRPI